ncbi:MAG: glycosyltransferase [Alphaproteobacteria bacterium]
MTRIAVLLPCYNEGVAIAAVVHDFRKNLPGAAIYVYDNNSQDNTIAEAKKAGAIVREEPLQGKGHVVRRMFSDVEADVYVMADGDGTYNAADADLMITLLKTKQLDMVIGARVAKEQGAYRFGHALGNRLFNGVVACLFGDRFQDIFSGFRVFSRRFVKSFPALSHGFDIETELSVHSLELNLPVHEVPSVYGERPAGSTSKLRTVVDGIRILKRIFFLLMHVKPLLLFGTVACAAVVAALVLGYPLVSEFITTGLVPRLPTAILATGLMILGFLSLTCGLILNSVSYGRREAKRLAYLMIPALHPD